MIGIRLKDYLLLFLFIYGLVRMGVSPHMFPRIWGRFDIWITLFVFRIQRVWLNPTDHSVMRLLEHCQSTFLLRQEITAEQSRFLFPLLEVGVLPLPTTDENNDLLPTPWL